MTEIEKYAVDLDGVWHKRPAGDEERYDSENSRPWFNTMCGQYRQGEPLDSMLDTRPAPDDLDDGETLCLCIDAEDVR